MGAIGGALAGEEVVEAGGAVVGGLVIDDPEKIFAGGVGFGAGVEDAVDADRRSAGGGLSRVVVIGPCGKGEFAGGSSVGCEQPEPVGIAQNVFEGGAGFAGEAIDGGVEEGRRRGAGRRCAASRREIRRAARRVIRPARMRPARIFEAGVDGIAEGARGEGAFGAGEQGADGFGGAGGRAIEAACGCGLRRNGPPGRR